MIEQLSEWYCIKQLCAVLGVSRSAYYAYQKGGSSQDELFDSALAKELKRTFEEHKRRYGSRRLYRALRNKGYEVGRHRVRRLMRELSLQAIQPRSFVPKTTQVDGSRRRSPNLLLDKVLPPIGINSIWVGDITYLPARQGWLYLSIWMDLCSRHIVGWQVQEHMQASLVLQSLQQAHSRRRVKSGLIIHSDGGGQYKAQELRTWLAQHQFEQSMTRKENHYDNAFMESLFSRIKAELLSDDPCFEDVADAHLRLFEYIEGYYNTIRMHSALDYISPMQFEQNLEQEQRKQ